jgi:hypothetical protein
MKKIFEFNLPEDRYDFEVHSKAPEMACVLTEVAMILRIATKYNTFGDRQLNESEIKLFEELHGWFYKTIDENDLKIDEL